ncbi:hypothetical protein O1L60_39185 [Streptomyces diastatochromogenes]|nr:hypothetical protein [Streptomyces diastatochromogenes]MCZ0982923.1 hypothetical protein [Streptomyces diastatochromogenes]
MDFPHHSTYRVPTKRPYFLAELRSSLPSVDDRVRAIVGHGDPTEYEEIADSLYRVFVTVRNLALPRSSTGCGIHPNGPVDPEPPEGWGQCLFCNSNRRVGDPRARRGMPRQPGVYQIPPPPYTHEGLLQTMRQINDLSFDLHFRSDWEEFTRVADLVHGAFIIARELSRPRSYSRCRQHPGAPVDPAASGGPRCLFCVADEKRRAPAVPPAQIRDRERRPALRPRRRDLPVLPDER